MNCTRMIAKYVLLLTVITFLGSCAEGQSQSSAIIKSSNIVSSNVYQIIAKDGENVLFCPVSFHLLMSLVTLGARGKTEQELKSGLQLGYSNAQIIREYKALLRDIEKTTELKLATRLFPNDQVTLVKIFLRIAQTFFDSDVQKIDYSNPTSAAKIINTFVEEKTNNKIKDLLSPNDLDLSTTLVLVNAAYFNASWLYPFQHVFTGDFYVNKDLTVQTNLMSITKTFNYAEIASLDAKVLQIPFQNRSYSMLYILPNAADGIKGLEDKLKGVNIGELTTQLSSYVVRVTIPKFKTESTLNLNDVLKKLGVEEVFTNNANLSGIVKPPPPVSISKVVQKTYIDVNENGVEAAAATAVIISTTSLIFEQKIFEANRPFVYAILYNKLVLFVGKLAKP